MKNIDYLELFFKKHNLSGRVSVNYSSKIVIDEYMTDIVFEDGLTINIHDIIFDVDSELPEYIAEQWMKEKKERDISLIDWVQEGTHYMPEKIDTTSLDDYKKELEGLVGDLKESMTKIFTFIQDEGDSEEESEDE